MSQLKRILCGVVLVLICSVTFAGEYTIKKIRVTGLQRIDRQTVLNYLPVKVGDSIDTSQTPEIIRSLYKTNFFTDISLDATQDALVIAVIERPVIGTIRFVGNSKISNKEMDGLLKNAGLAEGEAMDQALLNVIVHAVVQQYANLGYHNAKVETSIKRQARNRVAVTVSVKEGSVVKVESITIVGNKAFSEGTLRSEMSLSTPKPWSFFTDSDKYSEEKLSYDIEALKEYYLDHGYLNFKVNSKSAIITPDKKHVVIKIDVSEGAPYKIKGFNLEGSLLGKRNEISKLVTVKTGDVFSRKDVIVSQKNIVDFLGNQGYGSPDIRVEPVVDDAHKQVLIKFIVNAGKRIYVRRISFSGNNKTHDEVLRREMRQQEGSLYSLAKIDESKRQLSVLGYLQNVQSVTTPVPGDPGQVDLTYKLQEDSAITAGGNIGFSDADGFLYGANLKDDNIFGTGKSTGIGFSNSKANQNYSVSYYDPYFTKNHISFGLEGYFQRSDQEKKKSLSSYSEDVHGAMARFGLPLSDYSRVTLGLGFERIKIHSHDDSSDEIKKFIEEYGDVYGQGKVTLGWSYSSFNKAIFPTKGFSQKLNLALYVPIANKSLQFYTVRHNTSWYLPLFKGFVFHTNTELGYGDGFGKTEELPFFKNFFAGGMNTVRGFESGSLGKIDSKDKSMGGNVLAAGSASLIIPNPHDDKIRTSIFIDAGNAFENKFKLDELRVSCGVQVEIFIAPIGLPLTFSLAHPIRKKTDDRDDLFQFSIAFGL